MFCICIIWNKDGEQKKNCQIGIFLSGIGKKPHIFGIGNGAEFRPQNQVIESPDSAVPS